MNDQQITMEQAQQMQAHIHALQNELMATKSAAFDMTTDLRQQLIQAGQQNQALRQQLAMLQQHMAQEQDAAQPKEEAQEEAQAKPVRRKTAKAAKANA